MAITLRQLARHTHNKPPKPLTLRKILGQENANLQLQVKNAPFSIMTHNLALTVFPASYNGTDREGVVKEIVSRIQASSPDVVGLCEVFANGERATIRAMLLPTHPYFHEGPGLEGPLSDGGLLLLSKHPIIENQQLIYPICAGEDCLANKGVLHVRVHPPSSTRPYEIFLSHTQNLDPMVDTGAQAALYKQLSLINHMVTSYANPNNPTLIMGDLNIPGEKSAHYKELISRLGNAVDLWTVAGNSPKSGFTFVSDNNFYADDDDNPHENTRLDYILMKAGLKAIPILKSMEILKFTRGGRFISDHFGLRANFEQFVQVDF